MNFKERKWERNESKKIADADQIVERIGFRPTEEPTSLKELPDCKSYGDSSIVESINVK